MYNYIYFYKYAAKYFFLIKYTENKLSFHLRTGTIKNKNKNELLYKGKFFLF